MPRSVLVTGGAGFIGSHAVLALLEAGYRVVVLDNFCNSSAESLRRVESLAGSPVPLVKGDIRDSVALAELFSKNVFHAVMHFAGLKSVADSVASPIGYYENNVVGTLTLCQAMANAGVRRMIFSSSATVYGETGQSPIAESCPTGTPANPYGRSKLMVEEILRDIVNSDPTWHVGLLRYFNPVGAHPSGLIGEDPRGVPSNLVPMICQVAVGRRDLLKVFGNHYPTPDGTGVRDYIHVQDLVDGHVRTLEVLESRPGIGTWNLGTGKGYSVLELIRCFESVTGHAVSYEVCAHRPGDVAACWADPSLARDELGWVAQYQLDDMLRDAWRWQVRNPYGFETS